MTMTKNDAYSSNELQLQNHSLTSMLENNSLLSAASILSPSPIAYNTTSSLDKQICTDFADFGKCQDTFGHFSWSKIHSNFLDVKLKVFEKDDNKKFRLVQNPRLAEANFSQFMPLRNQLVIAAENLAREENLSPVLIPTLSKDMD